MTDEAITQADKDAASVLDSMGCLSGVPAVLDCAERAFARHRTRSDIRVSKLVSAAKAVLGCKCPQCNGWGEIAYFGEMVGCPCGGKFRHTPTEAEHNALRAALAAFQEASNATD